ncbi:hypothetical protein CsSME_00027639 [Camellia sinensis var. sinensis]
MIRRWQYTHSLKNTLLCLCLLSIAAKKRILEKGWPTTTNSGRLASGSGRQPSMVADRPPVEKLFKVKVQTEASKGKAVDFSGRSQPSMHVSLTREAILLL